MKKNQNFIKKNETLEKKSKFYKKNETLEKKCNFSKKVKKNWLFLSIIGGPNTPVYPPLPPLPPESPFSPLLKKKHSLEVPPDARKSRPKVAVFSR